MDLNLNLRDGQDETPLSLALWTDQFDIAQRLLRAGADIECIDREEPGMLYVAILREKPRAALFLLENGANYKKRSAVCLLLVLFVGFHLMVLTQDPSE